MFFIFIFSTNSGADTNAGTCLPISKGGTNCDSAAIVDYIKTDLLNTLYPVGTILTSTTNTNPSGRLGGTWTQFGQGRTLLGVGSNSANTTTAYGSTAAGAINRTTAEEAGGEASHTLTTAEMPSHNHTLQMDNSGTISASTTPVVSIRNDTAAPIPYGVGQTPSTGSATNNTSSFAQASLRINSTGGNGSHNNIQPYITVYFWKRTN